MIRSRQTLVILHFILTETESKPLYKIIICVNLYILNTFFLFWSFKNKNYGRLQTLVTIRSEPNPEENELNQIQ